MPPLGVTVGTCAFDSHACSQQVSGHGGFDEHHEWPKFLGGADTQSTMLLLCPNHHRRQHSLIRALVEAHEHGGVVAAPVLAHFTKPERDAAAFAVAGWLSVGAPLVTTWGVDAAS